MAQQESEKEDLMREATAMVARAEIRCDSMPELITMGFFSDDRFSIYFAQDRFYQFDADAKLRRAYCDGFLFRSQSWTLARLHRTRDGGKTVLQRTDLTPAALNDFRTTMNGYLQAVGRDLESDHYRLLREISEDSSVTARAIKRLTAIRNLTTQFLSTCIAARR